MPKREVAPLRRGDATREVALLRFVEPAMNTAAEALMSDEVFWCPPGHIPLRRARTKALGWARNGVVDAAYVELFETPDLIDEVFGSSLAQGSLRAVGVSLASGKLVTITPQDWRRRHVNTPGSPSFQYPIHAALEGYPIWVGNWPNEELCNVAVSLADLKECLPTVPQPEAEQPNGGSGREIASIVFKLARRRRGGAPPRHDWEAFWIEVVRCTARNGLHPDGRRGLQKHMEEWTAEHSGDPPEASTIRRRMMRLYGKLGRTPGAKPQDVPANPVHPADWDAFWIEVARYVAINDLGRRQDLQRHLLEWMERLWLARPKRADVSSRIARLYQARAAEEAKIQHRPGLG